MFEISLDICAIKDVDVRNFVGAISLSLSSLEDSGIGIFRKFHFGSSKLFIFVCFLLEEK